MSDKEEKNEKSEKKKPVGFSDQHRCYRCGIKGHYGYDCDLLNGKTAKSEKKKTKKFFEPDHTCYECGKKGHYAYDCVKRLIREREGDFKKGEKPSGRASPTYDEYFYDENGVVPKSSRSRDRSRSPQRPIEVKIKRKSKNIQNIRSLWQI